MDEIKQKYKSNEIVVNNKSNFKSHLVKCQSIMDNIHFDELVIRAMGKATFRACNLALHLNKNNFNTFELEPTTYSVDIVEDKSKELIKGCDKDKFDPDSIDIEKSKKTSHVPAIKIVVRKSRIEIDKFKKARKQDKDN